MIRLCTLGEAAIRIGRRHYGPEAEHVFAATLFLASQPGRRVPRQALLDLIWPRVPDDNRRHNLRQLLYKLRRAGVSCEVEGAHLTIPAESVTADYDPYFSATVSEGEGTYARVPFGTYLAGYSPSLSPAYAEWVEHRRGEVHGQIRRALLSAIVPLKHRGEWPDVERLARRVLELDELNEEATLALAEATAMSGSKAAAVAMLDRYVEELGPGATDIRIPASILRRRIKSSVARAESSLQDAPLRGREALIGSITSALNDRTPGFHWVVGETGMGKSRILREVQQLSQIHGFNSITIASSPEQGGGLALLGMLVRELLSSPGALGSSTGSYQLLKRFAEGETAVGQAPTERQSDIEDLLFDAISDLSTAIAAETTLALIVDDLDHADELFAQMVVRLGQSVMRERILIAVSSTCEAIDRLAPPRHCVFYRLSPLSNNDALRFLADADATIPDAIRKKILTLGAGNPLFLRELLRHWRAHNNVDELPPNLSRAIESSFDRLSPVSRRTVQAVTLLGSLASFERVRETLGIDVTSLLDAVDEADQSGMLTSESLAPRHEAIGTLATSRLSVHTSRALHRRIAHSLTLSAPPTPELTWLRELRTHWREAQDIPETLSSSVDYAKELASRGLIREGARVLEDTIAFGLTDGKAAAAFEQLAQTYALCSDWTKVSATWERFAAWSNARSQAADFHSETELLAMEAQWHLESRVSFIGARALRCVGDTRAPTDHRLHALAIGMAASDNACDASLREQLFEMGKSIAAATLNGRAYRLQADLIYHTSAGIHPSALDAADSLAALCESIETPGLRLQSLRHASTAYRAFGRVSPAMALLERAAADALKNDLNDQAAVAYLYLASLALQRHELSSAETFHALALGAGLHPSDSVISTHSCLIRARIELGRGEWQRAIGTLPGRDSILAMESMRDRSALLAAWILANICSDPDFKPDASDLFLLSSSLARRAHVLPADHIAIAAYRGLARLHREDDALSLLTSFVEMNVDRQLSPEILELVRDTPHS